MARDGHLVYGPYNESGELWSCAEYDVCNGAFLEDGSYAYITKSEAPFSLNCWGSAEKDSSCPDFKCIGPFYEYSMRTVQVVAYTVGSILTLIIIFLSYYCFVGLIALIMYLC